MCFLFTRQTAMTTFTLVGPIFIILPRAPQPSNPTALVVCINDLFSSLLLLGCFETICIKN